VRILTSTSDERLGRSDTLIALMNLPTKEGVPSLGKEPIPW